MQFLCSSTIVNTVFYSLNSKSILPLAPNVDISAPTVIGGATVVNMSISNASANAVITCRAYLVNGTVLNRTAYLMVHALILFQLTFLFSMHCVDIWNVTCPATLS